MKDIIEYIISEINKRTLNLKEFANKNNIPPTTLYEMRNQGRQPSIETFAKLCKILNLSADDLLELNTNPELSNFEREIVNILRLQELSDEKKDQIRGMLKLLLKTDDAKLDSKTRK